MYNSKYKNKKSNKNMNTSFSKEKEVIKTYTTTSRLYLREGPDKDKTAITIIPKDTQVTYLNYQIDNWYKVKYNDYIGFCMSDWLK